MIWGMEHPQRGLRQSYPLSPYLFILCAEIFSSLIHVAEVAKLIQGIRFSKDLMVSDLFFRMTVLFSVGLPREIVVA